MYLNVIDSRNRVIGCVDCKDITKLRCDLDTKPYKMLITLRGSDIEYTCHSSTESEQFLSFYRNLRDTIFGESVDDFLKREHSDKVI
jgi:hypothetical protein